MKSREKKIKNQVCDLCVANLPKTQSLNRIKVRSADEDSPTSFSPNISGRFPASKLEGYGHKNGMNPWLGRSGPAMTSTLESRIRPSARSRGESLSNISRFAPGYVYVRARLTVVNRFKRAPGDWSCRKRECSQGEREYTVFWSRAVSRRRRFPPGSGVVIDPLSIAHGPGFLNARQSRGRRGTGSEKSRNSVWSYGCNLSPVSTPSYLCRLKINRAFRSRSRGIFPQSENK